MREVSETGEDSIFANQVTIDIIMKVTSMSRINNLNIEISL